PQRRGAQLGPEAIELRKAIAKNSKDYEALDKLAVLYLGAGDPLGAQLVLDKAAEGGADSATYNLRAVVAFAMGDPQQASAELKRALERDGSNPRARLNLAALYGAYGFKKQAEIESAKVRSAPGVMPGEPALFPGVQVPGGGAAKGGKR